MNPIRSVKVAIVGAGIAGLSALKIVKQFTDDFVVIDQGPLGTTSARSGCMPSKALTEAANVFHNRHFLPELGISGTRQLQIEPKEVLKRVRLLRDRFIYSPTHAVQQLGDRFILGQASFVTTAPNKPLNISVGSQQIYAEKVIIATGSTPIVPIRWQRFGNRILTSETLFEQETLPDNIVVVGLGRIGLELGLALSRLGSQVTGIEASECIGGISDPEIQYWAQEMFSTELTMYTGKEADLFEEADQLVVQLTGTSTRIEPVEKVLVAMGRKPALDALNLHHIGIEFNSQGLPIINPDTLEACIPNCTNSGIYIVGDANGQRALSHESADEGRIAAFHALAQYRSHGQNNHNAQYQRRVPIHITFTDPQIAYFGLRYEQLDLERTAIGSADFSFQSRALIMGCNKGLVRLYADRQTRCLLGGEMLVPRAEHFAFELACCVHNKMTIDEIAHLPFYHPTMEEGLRTALYALSTDLGETKPEQFLGLQAVFD
ncbi:dihydrolipoamide dehydrogenase [Oceanospirillum multiglobuliferum]|uniref:Dihydrolipoyl dehydrogenase n=1 Tax=Oceanospirillum multiglobuliferum TaxID=64969 RepID=A0A1T4LX31_9GAMM|nr:dihydrolipoyl dehydrogenase [Oceanospirillum multiglobuliferum]OPX56331.1 dihydrolipoyl dehydrogenase [Oceanospirillum multiglobuliferum]SJZ59186.1 dihydrolipoamide dehydrogenase [Oceanospirillum multiglobuliferum]